MDNIPAKTNNFLDMYKTEIESIIKREDGFKISFIKHCVEQGLSIIKILDDLKSKDSSISQNKLAVELKMGSATISRYVSIARNEKIVSIVNEDVPSLEQLEKFNQNELAKLAKLENEDFNKVLEEGKFPENEKKNERISYRNKYETITDKIKTINENIKEPEKLTKEKLLSYISELTNLLDDK